MNNAVPLPQAPRLSKEIFCQGIKTWCLFFSAILEGLAFQVNVFAFSKRIPIPVRGASSPNLFNLKDLPLVWTGLGYRYIPVTVFCLVATVYCIRGKRLRADYAEATRTVGFLKMRTGAFFEVRQHEIPETWFLLALAFAPIACTVFDLFLFWVEQKTISLNPGWSLAASLLAGALSFLALVMNWLEAHGKRAREANKATVRIMNILCELSTYSRKEVFH